MKAFFDEIKKPDNCENVVEFYMNRCFPPGRCIIFLKKFSQLKCFFACPLNIDRISIDLC